MSNDEERDSALAAVVRGGEPLMNLETVLAQLREERDRLDAAISNLEDLDQRPRRGPGRRARFVTKNPASGTNHRHRPSDPTPQER